MKVAITVRKRVMIFAVMFVARCIYPCEMDGIIVRRVIPSDNSCLFNAVGYVTDHDKNKAPELRQILICYILSLLLNMCSYSGNCGK
ncbi:OVARIAN TUMOR DOMAIN-containing deubiquitinating enzyme 2-like [Pistacia vera]|uniref:OVARIAN TUMOR DOMAIN-containing deubiquitinating enzyme 2-like n=1 Tax=Pistacia vera TaxID=55513 RepID=UPI001262CF95|nr:OVARIAN TUMOR DOMAIN-containing deubiquitinating enzyme 2-like [Pistacia vera]XP_031260188.1 OVARIAN TUMOR DOMAIN-containing deubiquitinating enzyme 2-like [Pistacia vera]